MDIKGLREDFWNISKLPVFGLTNPLFWTLIIAISIIGTTLGLFWWWTLKKVYLRVREFLWVRKYGDTKWCRECYKNIHDKNGWGSPNLTPKLKKRRARYKKVILKRRWKLINQATKYSCQTKWQSTPF